MSTETEKQVSDYLAAIGVTYRAAHCGFRRSEGEGGWMHDAWRVAFSRNGKAAPIETDYKTGCGHRRNRAGKAPGNMPKFIHFDDCERWLDGSLMAHPSGGPYRAVRPDAAGVLHSLFLDVEAANESFADWCDNFGYSADSISALNTYQACDRIGRQVRAFFSREESDALRVMLEDY